MGKATKDHVGEDPNWDVYTLTSVMGHWMKEVFATHLYAKEIVLFALQAQQARTSRAHGHFPFEYEVLDTLLHLASVVELCLGKSSVAFEELTDCITEAQALFSRSLLTRVIPLMFRPP